MVGVDLNPYLIIDKQERISDCCPVHGEGPMASVSTPWEAGCECPVWTTADGSKHSMAPWSYLRRGLRTGLRPGG